MATTQAGKLAKRQRLKKVSEPVVQNAPVPDAFSKFNSFEIVDWFRLHGDSQSHPINSSASNLLKNPLLSFLWPASTAYHSPINPVFVASCFSVEIFNRQPVWMARDGLLPLLWFYKLHPTPPPAFKSRILIHDDFSPYVPTAWRRLTGTYRLVGAQSASEAPMSQVLFMGLVNEICCDAKVFKRLLARALETLSQDTDIKAVPKRCFFLERQAAFVDSAQSFYPNLIFELGRACSLENFEALDWKTLDATTSFVGTSFVEFSDRLLLADSYLAHLVLSRGGTMIPVEDRTPRSVKSHTIKLSPYHGVEIFEKLEGQFMLNKERRSSPIHGPYWDQFETIMRSNANMKIPWPAWMKTWMQEANS